MIILISSIDFLKFLYSNTDAKIPLNISPPKCKLQKNKKFSTRSIHKGQVPEKLYGAISLPIYLTSTFRQKEFAEYEYDYSIVDNVVSGEKSLEEWIKEEK